MDAIVSLLPAAWRPYAKSVIAALGTIVTAVLVVVPADELPRWAVAAVAALTALGVYGVPNVPKPPVE